MDPFIGQMMMFAGNFAPRGWALCDGRLLAISSNSALFSILGTTYGGDGRTTFALPDLRGRVAIGEGNGPGLRQRTLGQQMGREEVALGLNEMPAHTHTVNSTKLKGNIVFSTEKGNTNIPSATTLLAQGISKKGRDEIGNANIYHTSTVASGSIEIPTSGDISIGNAGASQAHDNMQPSLVINYIIALEGVYPSRS